MKPPNLSNGYTKSGTKKKECTQYNFHQSLLKYE
jgi:hypothetical protein